MVLKAASHLRGTGLFEPDEIEEFDLYNEYKRAAPDSDLHHEYIRPVLL